KMPSAAGDRRGEHGRGHLSRRALGSARDPDCRLHGRLTQMDASKRSQAVKLTLVGLPVTAIALSHAFPGHDIRRNHYADRAACERDYSPAQCEANSSSSSGTTSSRSGDGWHGPYYSVSRAAALVSDPGPGRIGLSNTVESSTRGGFGAFGRAMR